MTDDAAHILVVDDDARLRDLLKEYLANSGFRVSAALSAADARRKMNHVVFDLIVLDLMMPGETGLQFAETLRVNDSVPILMLTAMGEAESRIQGLEAGADDYLAKPFEPRELVLRINSILRHPRLVAVKAWALSHLLVNGDLGSLLLFGSLLVWAIYDRIAVKRRGDQGAPRRSDAGDGTSR